MVKQEQEEIKSNRNNHHRGKFKLNSNLIFWFAYYLIFKLLIIKIRFKNLFKYKRITSQNYIFYHTKFV